MTEQTIALSAAGVSMLIFRGTDHEVSVPNPDEGRPGVRATTYQGDPARVLIEPMGYESYAEASIAIAKSAQACLDSGLRVSFARPGQPNTRIVSRRPR